MSVHQSINNGVLPSETESLTDTQKLNEYIMISLRTREGLDLTHVETAWGFEKVSIILKKAARYVEQDLLQRKNEKLHLTNDGMLLADGIAADLFFLTAGIHTSLFYRLDRRAFSVSMGF